MTSAVNTYNETLINLVDRHAPEKSREVTDRTDSPWYSQELAHEKRIRRKLEHKYKHTKLVIDKEQYCEQRNKYNQLLSNAKKDYYNSKIQCAKSSKELFKICNKLLNREKKLCIAST